MGGCGGCVWWVGVWWVGVHVQGLWRECILCVSSAVCRCVHVAVSSHAPAITPIPPPFTHSNRAACYTKLGALPEALKDAEECITLNPSFVKGYTRKATAQFLMKEYEKAMETYQQGLEHEGDNAECKEGIQRCYQQLARVCCVWGMVGWVYSVGCMLCWVYADVC